jgi:hypothetical protein
MTQPNGIVFVRTGFPLTVGVLEKVVSPETSNVFAVNLFVTSRFPVLKSARATDATTANNTSANRYFTSLTMTS